MNTLPQYLQDASLVDTEIRYQWDDWASFRKIVPDPTALEPLTGLSQRACLAFAVAASEWIVHRFSGLFDDPDPYQYIESCWARGVDLTYSRVLWMEDIDQSHWEGPVRRPISATMDCLGIASYRIQNDESHAEIAASVVTLAKLVIDDFSAFQAWHDAVLSRLLNLYEIDPNDTMGDVVPASALDPGCDFVPEQTELSVNEFLGRISPDTNPFLSTPEEMIEDGFVGQPYKFDFTEDLVRRRDW